MRFPSKNSAENRDSFHRGYKAHVCLHMWNFQWSLKCIEQSNWFFIVEAHPSHHSQRHMTDMFWKVFAETWKQVKTGRVKSSRGQEEVDGAVG